MLLLLRPSTVLLVLLLFIQIQFKAILLQKTKEKQTLLILLPKAISLEVDKEQHSVVFLSLPLPIAVAAAAGLRPARQARPRGWPPRRACGARRGPLASTNLREEQNIQDKPHQNTNTKGGGLMGRWEEGE